MRTSTKTVHIKRFKVEVKAHHINDGACRNANKCMIRLAVEAALRELEPDEPNHWTKVANGRLTFHSGGWHWKAELAKVALRNLIEFDKEEKARLQAKLDGAAFLSKVRPFAFTVEAHRGGRKEKPTPERAARIREMRRIRIVERREKPRLYTLKKRIVGCA
jgi:hypothetical protein